MLLDTDKISLNFLCFQDNLLAHSSVVDEDAVTVSAPPIVPASERRPKSVPVQLTRRPDSVRKIYHFFGWIVIR